MSIYLVETTRGTVRVRASAVTRPAHCTGDFWSEEHDGSPDVARQWEAMRAAIAPHAKVDAADVIEIRLIG